MMWPSRKVAEIIFDCKTEREIRNRMKALRLACEKGKWDAIFNKRTWYFVTDGMRIFAKEKPQKEERGRLTGRGGSHVFRQGNRGGI